MQQNERLTFEQERVSLICYLWTGTFNGTVFLSVTMSQFFVGVKMEKKSYS